MSQSEPSEEPIDMELVVDGLTYAHHPGEDARFNPFNVTMRIQIPYPETLLCTSTFKTRNDWLRNVTSELNFTDEELTWIGEFTKMVRARIEASIKKDAKLACFSFVGGAQHGVSYTSQALQHHVAVQTYINNTIKNLRPTIH